MTQQEATAMKNCITQLEEENQRLHQQVSYLQKHIFGRKSEKTSVVFDGQINLFDEDEQEAKKNAPEPDLQTVKEHRRKKRLGSAKNFWKIFRVKKRSIRWRRKTGSAKDAALRSYP